MHRIILHHIPLTQPPIETSFYLNLNFPRNFFEKRNTKRSSHISTYFREIETSSYSFYFSTENQVHAVVAFGSREFAGREEEGKKVARKFSHSESKGSSSTRLEADPICRSYALLGSVYVVNTRAIPYRAAIPHAKNSARQRPAAIA